MTSTNVLVSNIINSQSTQNLLQTHGLKAYETTWEDNGRNKNSSTGPLISDMTLVVKSDDRWGNLMPIIRCPNFSDVTDDVPIERFNVNYKNSVITLEELLKELNVHDSRDSVILTSNQCCVLPVESHKKTQFAIQLFNYQSMNSAPAVLVIVASKYGTSIQVVGSSNAKLFFDDNGTSRWFLAERLEDVRNDNNVSNPKANSFKELTSDEKLNNSIMIIQVPLKVPTLKRGSLGTKLGCTKLGGCDEKSVSLESVGMDFGQIGLGEVAGKFTGTNGITLVRNPDFPIRCTFQYYRVTDRDNIDEKNIIDIKEQLNQSHKVSIGHGSLILNPASNRITEPYMGTRPIKDD